MMRLTKESFLDFLQEQCKVTNDMRDILITEHKISDQPLEYLALDAGMISEDGLIRFFAEQRHCKIAKLSDHDENIAHLIKIIPFKDLEENVVLPFKVDEEEKVITFAMFDLSNLKSREHIENLLPFGYKMNVEIAKKSEILNALSLHAPAIAPSSNTQHTIDNKVVGQFLYSILIKSIQKRASDIHFEPETFFVRIRIRCDGVLKTLKCFHKSLWQEVNIQIKVLSGMDISESRLPQDGRFDLPILGKSIDFRVSSHPTDQGESIVLRTLEKNGSLISLKKLGYSPHALNTIEKIIQKPEGLILVTGPTGSGKTTSLYSILSSFDKEQNNIVTLEEPIEYKISGIRQSEVGYGLDFYAGIHSILRQDPDIILIGEIRDEKIAETVIRAGMTGHKVLSTLHTTRAINSIDRLIELKTPLNMIASTLNGIINQRLVRLLCHECKKQDRPSEKEIKELHLNAQDTICRPVGCNACSFSGYKGRKIIAETFFFDQDTRSLILHNPSYKNIYDFLFKKGFKTLEDEAALMVQNLETSAEEVFRTLGSQQ